MTKLYLGIGKKGQLIVFGVLIFPVIFFCLAMVINVGMVVHDKINLQNSVDLAAIYAAQKQAEVMDAMAHINYQMRQSYKLFTWRYLVLGNSGAFVHPKISSQAENYKGRYVMNLLYKDPKQRALCPNANNGDCSNIECNSDVNKEKCPYALCTVHPLFSAEWYGDDTHVCQGYWRGKSFALPPTTPQIGPIFTLSILANDMVRDFRIKLKNNCSNLGYQNWLIAVSMYLAFLKEQVKRKEFIEDKLFRLLVEAKDIDNKPIRTGVEHTILKNLTYVNYENFISSPALDFKIIQSGAAPVNSSTSFNAFYKWDEISPVPYYVQNKNEGDPSKPISDNVGSFCENTAQTIFQCDPDESIDYLKSEGDVEKAAMKPIVQYKAAHEPITRCEMLKEIWHKGHSEKISGFYKNSPNNLGVRVVVSLPYKGQLFSPFFARLGVSPMTLKAEAYAKPFGAGFGPSRPEQQDKLIPRQSAGLKDNMLFPNYSRYPGDLYGLTDERVHWAWNFLFTEGDKFPGNYMRDTSKKQGRTFNNYSDLPNNMDVYKDSMVLQYNEVSGPSTPGGYRVDLGSVEIFNKRMRIYEEIAIAPDKFDLTYYTILPNYMVTLYPRLKKSFPGDQYVPADLGHFRNENATQIVQPGIYKNHTRGHTPEFRLNYIERQIIYVQKQSMEPPFDSLGIPSIFNGYKVKGIDELLTSWAPDQAKVVSSSQDMYDGRPFQQCDLTDEDVKLTFGNSSSEDPFLDLGLERKMIPSHCLKGGRTGFSVKLIHPSAL